MILTKGDGIVLLSMMDYNEAKRIIKINGRDEQKRFLESLGFVEGAEVSVINKTGGNVIVNIKESRVAISSSVANKIIV